MLDAQIKDISRHIAIIQAQAIDRDGDYYISTCEQIKFWLRTFAPTLDYAYDRLARLKSISEMEWLERLSEVEMSIHFTRSDREFALEEGYVYAPHPTLDELKTALSKHIAELKLYLS